MAINGVCYTTHRVKLQGVISRDCTPIVIFSRVAELWKSHTVVIPAAAVATAAPDVMTVLHAAMLMLSRFLPHRCRAKIEQLIRRSSLAIDEFYRVNHRHHHMHPHLRMFWNCVITTLIIRNTTCKFQPYAPHSSVFDAELLRLVNYWKLHLNAIITSVVIYGNVLAIAEW